MSSTNLHKFQSGGLTLADKNIITPDMARNRLVEYYKKMHKFTL